MSGMKDYMLEVEAAHSMAVDVLVRAGAAKRCPYHGGYFSTGDEEAIKRAYAIGTSMIKRGEIRADRSMLMEEIKKAAGDCWYGCPRCEDEEAE